MYAMLSGLSDFLRVMCFCLILYMGMLCWDHQLCTFPSGSAAQISGELWTCLRFKQRVCSVRLSPQNNPHWMINLVLILAL